MRSKTLADGSNGLSVLQRKQWIADAVKAGFKAVKDGARTELTKAGWIIWVDTEEDGTINGWGPDKLVIIPPPKFSMRTLNNRLKICGYCKEPGQSIGKIGFAGRACSDCYKEHVAEIEFPGWSK
jgi:hypothetical protein